MRIMEGLLRKIIREELSRLDEIDDEEEPIDPHPRGGKLGPGDGWLSSIPQDAMTTATKDKIRSIRDTSAKLRVDSKPFGLWYAPGSEWIDWMSEYANSWLNDVNYIYEIKPNYDRVLRITSVDELDNFSREYGSQGSIDWPRVAEQWDGIEIAPLIQSMYRWYWDWSIASGCIWRPSGAEIGRNPILSRPGYSGSKSSDRKGSGYDIPDDLRMAAMRMMHGRQH